MVQLFEDQCTMGIPEWARTEFLKHRHRADYPAREGVQKTRADSPPTQRPRAGPAGDQSANEFEEIDRLVAAREWAILTSFLEEKGRATSRPTLHQVVTGCFLPCLAMLST